MRCRVPASCMHVQVEDRTPHKSGRPPPRSAGEFQMAVTAIDHGGRVVTVTSQAVEIASKIAPPHVAFATSIYGGPLSDLAWQAASWSACLRHHALAVIRSSRQLHRMLIEATNGQLRQTHRMVNAPEPRSPKAAAVGFWAPPRGRKPWVDSQGRRAGSRPAHASARSSSSALVDPLTNSSKLACLLPASSPRGC